ncbi:MAG: hypothetical protein E3J72_08005 [Planctomycetota bacterium]|nr:MAG: hypothetical protein E3J72_08005 [Planctomycetota bacterium]
MNSPFQPDLKKGIETKKAIAGCSIVTVVMAASFAVLVVAAFSGSEKMIDRVAEVMEPNIPPTKDGLEMRRRFEKLRELDVKGGLDKNQEANLKRFADEFLEDGNVTLAEVKAMDTSITFVLISNRAIPPPGIVQPPTRYRPPVRRRPT